MEITKNSKTSSDILFKEPLNKVPEITIFFWIIKLLTTGMGETFSDYLVHELNPIFAVAIGGIAIVAALVLQFSVRRYVAWIYWLAAAMVAIFGTMAADVLHIGLGIPYIVSAIFFMITLTIIFMLWYKSEKTLSIHSINTRRREMFYWATVLTTFALGTAVGDMTATTLGLGYFYSGILFSILFAIPVLAYWCLGLNGIFSFWAAYILTRPLGASFADWIGRSHSLGGLGLGQGWISMILAVLIIFFVSYLTITKKDAKNTNRNTHP